MSSASASNAGQQYVPTRPSRAYDPSHRRPVNGDSARQAQGQSRSARSSAPRQPRRAQDTVAHDAPRAQRVPRAQHAPQPTYNASSRLERAGAPAQSFDSVEWGGDAQGASRAGATVGLQQSIRGIFTTHPRAWSNKQRWIAGLSGVAVLIIIIGAAAGSAHSGGARQCTCPGWTSSDGVYFPETHYLCDADGNDVTTGVSNPCG